MIPQLSCSAREGRVAMQRSTYTLLRTARGTETLFRILDDAAHCTTTLVEHSPQCAQHACRAGCFFCCYLPVDITPIEALGMAIYLRATLPPDIYVAMYERLAVTVAQVHGFSFEEHAQAKIPCAMLVDGVCGVYPRRPFACRAWLATDVARCEEIFQGDPLARLPSLDTDVYSAIWEVAHGVMAGTTAARLEGGSYELHSALLRALETPDAAQRWLRGESVFMGCTVGAFAE